MRTQKEMATMAAPFVQIQAPPTNLTGYDRTKPPSEQPPGISKTFLDAMLVREEVFVLEQGVELEYELDEDDPRSCHWVAYRTVSRVVEEEMRDPDTGEVVRPGLKETASQPIGTLRVVPFPHPPHSIPGGKVSGLTV